MPIKFIKGNIFNSKAQTVVNTVNCVGVMGKGIALVFKLRYPKMFDIYRQYCKDRHIGIGKLWLYKGEEKHPWVLNFPTKYHWKYPSKLEYLEKGLDKFVQSYKEKGITSVAFPLLGAHNGGLDKEQVLSLMISYLDNCDIPIEIYEYDPDGRDDLFDLFKQKWNKKSEEDILEGTGIRKDRIITISDQINCSNIKSMIGLIKSKGIGIRTIEKCFRFIIEE